MVAFVLGCWGIHNWSISGHRIDYCGRRGDRPRGKVANGPARRLITAMAQHATTNATTPPGAPSPLSPDEIDAALARLADFDSILLAVSGGSDSMALLDLAAQWRVRRPKNSQPELAVASVDHGLRPGSVGDARFVGAQCRALGLRHDRLVWSGDKPARGIQAAARAARYDLLAEHAVKCWPGRCVAIATAHTRDDQAETLLMRLARGSGVDGLSAIPETRPVNWHRPSVTLVRPLLRVSRERLRQHLTQRNVTWCEDPSNADNRFERVRLRAARQAMSDMDLSDADLAESARRLSATREALDWSADQVCSACELRCHDGAFAALRYEPFLAAPAVIRQRILSRLVRAFGGGADPPRLVRVEAFDRRLCDALAKGAPFKQTLAGSLISVRFNQVRVQREPRRTAFPVIELAPGDEAVWDGRFVVRLDGQAASPVKVGPCPRLDAHWGRRPEMGLSFDVACTLPAFFDDWGLLAVPHPLVGYRRSGTGAGGHAVAAAHALDDASAIASREAMADTSTAACRAVWIDKTGRR